MDGWLVGWYWWLGWFAPKIFVPAPGILINRASSKIDDVLAEDGGLLNVPPLAIHLNFFGTPPSCLKVIGWVVVVA